MADLNSYDEVIQVSEDMEYPEGYNSIEVYGGGDSRQERIFATVKITGPTSITSDGRTLAAFKIEVHDPNADNPFYVESNTTEEGSLIGPQEMTVQNWIINLHGVYEDQYKEKPIPFEYLTFDQNKIRILDGWSSSDVPLDVTGKPKWQGLFYQQAWVEYDGQLSLSVEDGLQVTERWWVYSGDDERQTEKDVSGVLFIDSEGKRECTSSSVPIPNTYGKDAVTYVYFRPDSGESGTAYVNAAYDSVPAVASIVVYAGSGLDNISFSLQADPSTISLTETSDLIVSATTASGSPVVSGTGSFYVYKGGGNIVGSNPNFRIVTGEVEEVYTSYNETTSKRSDFSLSKPISKITSIVAVGGGFVWNGKATISGTSVSLVDQEFSADVIPITVTYNYGGYASAAYKPGGADKIDDKIYCGFTCGGHNALCEITIGESSSSSSGSLSVTAEESSLAYNGTTSIIVTAENADGSAGTGTVNLSVVNGGRVSSTSVNLGTKSFVGAEGSINSLTTFTLPYPIHSTNSISSISFLGDTYYAASINDTTVTITGNFGVTSGTLTCNYTAKGYGETVFTAPSSGGPKTCYIVGKWSTADPKTATVTVDSSVSSNTSTLSLSAEESTLGWAGNTNIIIKATNADGSPGIGTVYLSDINGSTPASVSLGTKVLLGQKGRITGTHTFTVDYPIASLGSINGISFLGNNYSASAIDGSTVTISGSFPVFIGDCQLNYTAAGYASAKFTAPSQDIDCYVTGTWAGADPQAVMITVDQDTETTTFPNIELKGDPLALNFGQRSIVTCTCKDSTGADVSLSAITWTLIANPSLRDEDGVLTKPTDSNRSGSFLAPSRIMSLTLAAHYKDRVTYEQIKSEVVFLVTDGSESPPNNRSISLSASPSEVNIGEQSVVTATLTEDGDPKSGQLISWSSNFQGNLSVVNYATNSNGESIAHVTGDNSTIVKVTAANGSARATVNITIGGESEGTVHTIHVSGTIPNHPMISLYTPGEGSTVMVWGAASNADSNGGVYSRPVAGVTDVILDVPIPSAWLENGAKFPTSVETTSGTLYYLPSTDAGWRSLNSINVGFPWSTLEEEEGSGHTLYVGEALDPTRPIAGATVLVNGQTKVTDVAGKVTFESLPTGTLPVIITHPNYTPNNEDTLTTNDTYTVGPVVAGQRPYTLKAIDVDFTLSIRI